MNRSNRVTLPPPAGCCRATATGFFSGLAVLCLTLISVSGVAAADAILFNRDIRPIFTVNCFPCHGPDSASRKAGLRLDRRESALKIGAIVPGKPDESELVNKVFADDPADRMPPPASHKTLTASQKDLLRRWIAAGAEYQPHWSLIAPLRPPPPPVKNPAWARNPIDAFVLAALEQHGLQPAAEADRRTLARRLSLDLTGLPPTPAEVEAFVNDPSPAACENLADRLLASQRWGEHRARYWLDAARYADTHGIHFDNYREIWAYRDWVIDAFNRNLPFDRFTIEQLAGDLLPEATPQQRVASGFNRCNITTNEGGAINEEYLVLYARDRTETTARVWLGLTAGCAVCHDHKFDPLTQKEFYQMSAFFNNTTQAAMDGNVKDTPPTLFLPAAADRDRWPALVKELADARRQVEERKKTAPADPDKSLAARVAALEQEQKAVQSRGTAAYVVQERNEPARAFVLYRGEYDKRREQVGAETPAMLPPMPADLPKNRLGFARWLLRPEQPLTARVAVNRCWQEVFGTGLVRTAEDFGVNCEMPSHPELLDWLAVEFRESGWDVKKLFRLLVTSAAYRQASAATPEKLEKDPQNRLLSRGPRFRMDAEMVRDYALAASGLLVPKIGGPSVKPYQPDGVWDAVAMMESNTRIYRRDEGENLYRRSMYTFWKRAAPPAAMDILNAPSRETCTVRRERTDTPLQALVTLNDPQFVEAARRLAQTALKDGGPAGESRLDFVVRRLLLRPFRPEESQSAAATLDKLLGFYRAHPQEAKALLAVGESKADPALDAATLAAWTMLANQLMNLDEVLNK
ncbi:MAG: PSD1 and planctomycete cytochrome C domain-containing protein [Thermoguttaceae bacterium]